MNDYIKDIHNSDFSEFTIKKLVEKLDKEYEKFIPHFIFDFDGTISSYDLNRLRRRYWSFPLLNALK